MQQFNRRWKSVWLIFPLLMTTGCHQLSLSRADVPALPNPLEIPVEDHEFAWNELVDTVDNYFPIQREERVRIVGNVMTEGKIETQPRTGATIFEFFRRDATHGFERWLGTFQSIRRQAEVRVAPSSNGYEVTVIVRKELEDVARPEMSMVGSVVQRYDGSLVRPGGARVGGAMTLGWIPQGRDVALEQKMLAEIHERFYQLAPPPAIQRLPSQ